MPEWVRYSPTPSIAPFTGPAAREKNCAPPGMLLPAGWEPQATLDVAYALPANARRGRASSAANVWCCLMQKQQCSSHALGTQHANCQDLHTYDTPLRPHGRLPVEQGLNRSVQVLLAADDAAGV